MENKKETPRKGKSRTHQAFWTKPKPAGDESTTPDLLGGVLGGWKGLWLGSGGGVWARKWRKEQSSVLGKSKEAAEETTTQTP